MLCTLAEAVAATGSSKSSILGAIEAGRITATKDLFGEWRIERGELHRLYPPAGKDTGNAPHEYPAHDAGMLEVEIEALISAAGDGLRQPGDDQRRGNPGLGAGQAARKAAHHLFADPDRGDLWSPAPPNLGASDQIADPIAAPRQPELPFAAGLTAMGSQPATDDKPLPIDELMISAAEAIPAWDDEIRIGNRDRVLRPASSFGAQRTRSALIAVAIVAALGLGWIGGWSSYRLTARTESTPLAQKLDSSSRRSGSEHETVRLNASEPAREAPPAAQPVRKIGLAPATKAARSPERAQSAAQTAAASTKPVSSSPAPHTSILARPAAVAQQQAKLEPQRTPVPETKPTTIEGWTVREVAGGAAVLEGPNGVWRAMPGDTVPGVGRVASIVRWGSRWIVATSSGLISTQ